MAATRCGFVGDFLVAIITQSIWGRSLDVVDDASHLLEYRSSVRSLSVSEEQTPQLS